MYEAILKNAPYSIYAPITQFNLGLAFERQKAIKQARDAYQTVLDKYPNSDVCDDALYQIAYIYMRLGLTSSSQDLSALVLSRRLLKTSCSSIRRARRRHRLAITWQRLAAARRKPPANCQVLRLVKELQGGDHLLQRHCPQAAEIRRRRNGQEPHRGASQPIW